MSRFSGVLLVSDLDGTLLNSQREVSEGNLRALESFMAAGGLFCIATGRSKNTFEIIRRQIPTNTPGIFSNGALVFDWPTERVLLKRPLRGRYLELCAAVLDRVPEVALEAHFADSITVVRRGPASDMHLQSVGVVADDCDGIEKAPPHWLKALFADENGRLRDIYDWLLPQLGDEFDLVFSHPNLLELQDKQANKGAAVAFMAERLGIAPTRVYCIGDEQNDLSMLRGSAASFTPESGAEEVKRAATYVVPGCDHDAVRAAIEIIEDIDR